MALSIRWSVCCSCIYGSNEWLHRVYMPYVGRKISHSGLVATSKWNVAIIATRCDKIGHEIQEELLPRLRDAGWKAEPLTSCSEERLCGAIHIMSDLNIALKDLLGASSVQYNLLAWLGRASSSEIPNFEHFFHFVLSQRRATDCKVKMSVI